MIFGAGLGRVHREGILGYVDPVLDEDTDERKL
jgi:hypothetical protein